MVSMWRLQLADSVNSLRQIRHCALPLNGDTSYMVFSSFNPEINVVFSVSCIYCIEPIIRTRIPTWILFMIRSFEENFSLYLITINDEPVLMKKAIRCDIQRHNGTLYSVLRCNTFATTCVLTNRK